MPIFILAILVIISFLAFLAFSEQYGKEPETIFTLFFSVVLLGWGIASYKQEIQYQPPQVYQIQTCVEKDKTYQIINVNGKVENITQRLGASFKENSKVEIKTSKEWYLGIWWPAINEYNVVETEQNEKDIQVQQ